MNRIAHRHPATGVATPDTIPTPVPMPGRLPVSFHDWELHRVFDDVPLANIATDTVVTATGTITHVRHLDGTTLGRTMIVLTDDDGNSAHVRLDADVVRQLLPVLVTGTRLIVRGPVTRTIPSQPAGIDGRGIRVVTV